MREQFFQRRHGARSRQGFFNRLYGNAGAVVAMRPTCNNNQRTLQISMLISTKALLPVLAALLLAGCQSAPDNSDEPASDIGKLSPFVHSVTLDNGLKVIVKEDHRAPVVVAQVWYKVGASDEPDGKTGVAHVLEHMMFKGTKKHGVGEFSSIIAENGGRENAFTGTDYTAYFQTLEKSRLPISFELESDRMRNLIVDDDEFAKEVKVVMEERRMRTDDNPEARVYEKFNQTAYKQHPYGRPVIGWMKDLEHLTAQDIRDWYQKWYAPDNATLVVVGDVDPLETIEQAKKYYGPHQPSGIKRKALAPEPRHQGLKTVTVKAPATVPYILTGWHVPVLSREDPENDWEPYALEVLNGLLAGGDSARFPKNLQRGKGLVAQASAGYNMLHRGSTMFLVDANPSAGHSEKEVEQAMLAEIEDLRVNGPTQKELDRIKAQVIASDVFQQDSVYFQAMKLGQYETVGLDWPVSDQYVSKVRSITADQVKAVINKYLVDDNRVVAYLDMIPIDPKDIGKKHNKGGMIHGH